MTPTSDLELSLFDYHLPDRHIAQTPADRRDHSRLMVVHRRSGTVAHHDFYELPDLLPPATRLLRNTVSVLKARLHGRRPGGGRVQCLLLRPAVEAQSWWCLLRPGRRLPEGSGFNGPGYAATVRERGPGGECRVHFELERHPDLPALANEIGEMPLPPYIRRQPTDPRREVDEARYDTVYADPAQRRAAAAPTAGLHFTPNLLRTLCTRGHQIADLVLHVGLGTFQPVRSTTLSGHRMHSESYEIPAATRRILEDPATAANRLAVGTTTLRALEHYFRVRPAGDPSDRPWQAEADIFLYPPARFHVPALVTNFHLPRSTLLCLVAAFLTPDSLEGIDWLKSLYRDAIARDYRFYSYGDAMLILDR